MSRNQAFDLGEPRLASRGAQARVSVARQPRRAPSVERHRNDLVDIAPILREQRRVGVARSVQGQIRDLHREHRHEHGANGIRIHDVEETGAIQSRNVRLTVRGRVDVYLGGQTQETVPIEETEYAVVQFRTRRQLISGIKQQMGQLLSKIQALEADSPKKVFHQT